MFRTFFPPPSLGHCQVHPCSSFRNTGTIFIYFQVLSISQFHSARLAASMAGGEVGEPVGPAHGLHVVHVAAAAEVAAVRQVDLKLATTSANRVTEEHVLW